MAKPIVCGTYVSYSVISATTEATGYEATNIDDAFYPKRTWRSTISGANEIVIDFGESKIVQAVFLNNINSTSVVIKGSDTNDSSSWASPGYNNLNIVSTDIYVGRAKGYFTTTNFEYRYMQLTFQGTPIDGASYHKCGNLLCLNNTTTLSYAPQYPITEGVGNIPINVQRFRSGAQERTQIGSLAQWNAQLTWRGNLTEQEHYTLSTLGRTTPMVWFWNQGESQRAYLCFRDPSFDVVLYAPDVRSTVLNLLEVV